MLSLYDNVKLKEWSLSTGEPLKGPLWNGRLTYFVYYACANDIVPWDFWIDIEVNTIFNYTNSKIDYRKWLTYNI